MECTTIRAAVIAAINCEYDHTGDFWKLELPVDSDLRKACTRNYISDHDTMNQISDKLCMDMCETYGRSQQVKY